MHVFLSVRRTFDPGLLNGSPRTLSDASSRYKSTNCQLTRTRNRRTRGFTLKTITEGFKVKRVIEIGVSNRKKNMWWTFVLLTASQHTYTHTQKNRIQSNRLPFYHFLLPVSTSKNTPADEWTNLAQMSHSLLMSQPNPNTSYYQLLTMNTVEFIIFWWTMHSKWLNKLIKTNIYSHYITPTKWDTQKYSNNHFKCNAMLMYLLCNGLFFPHSSQTAQL